MASSGASQHSDDPRILALIEELTGKIALTERALRSMASGAGPQRTLSMSEFLSIYTKVKGMSDERERGPAFALQLHGVYRRSLFAYAQASGAELRALAEAAAGGAAAEASQRLLLAVLQRQEELKLLDRFLVRLCGGIGGGGEAASGGVLDRARGAGAEASPEALFCSAFMACIYEPLHAAIRDTVLGMLTAERNGEAVDRQAVRRVVALLHRYASYERAPGSDSGWPAFARAAAADGSSYQRQVHQPFVASATAYYAGASAEWLAAGVPVYLERVREALAREVVSMSFYMPFLNPQQVLYEVQDILLLRQQRGVLEEPHSGMRAMLVNDRRAPLALLCALYQGVRAPRAGEPFFKPGYSHDGSSGSGSGSANNRSIYAGGAAAAAAAAAATAADAASLEATSKAQSDFTLERMRPMAEIFYRHLQAQGEELLRARAPPASDKDKEATDQPEFCRGVLALHARAGELLAQCFNAHPAFAKALEAAFTELAGARPPQSGGSGGGAPRLATTELLVHYADRVLKGTDKADEGVQQGELRRCLALFCLERDKDVLGAVYRSLMAKRLLRKGGTGSTPLERYMVTQLENAFGQHFTARLSTMLEDIARGSGSAGGGGGGAVGNSGLMKPTLALPDGSRPPFDFSCQVLTSGSWPAFAPTALALPPPMAAAAAAFEAWYAREKGGSRRLAWCPAVGACTVRARYPAQPASGGNCSALPPREYDLELTNALQAAVLLLFNDPSADGLTPPAIAARLASSSGGGSGGSGGGMEVVRKLLHSLVCGKARVLRKAPEGGGIRDSDAFAYHAAFASAALRPAFPCPSLEDTHDPARIDEERRFAIDACIVRVMKARKTLGHNELVGLVLHQLTLFQPKLEAIKKRIEDLIEREFVARVEGQPSQYAYIA